MKKLYIVSLLAIFINTGLAQTQTVESSNEKLTLFDFVGIWGGEVSQSDADSYSLKVLITNQITGEMIGESVAEVEYPELKCNGTWILNEIKDDRIVLTEKIDNGKDCVNDGIVNIILNHDYAEYEWYYPNGKIACSARLQKE